MKAKRSALNVYLCTLLTAATLTLSACTSSSVKKIESVNAFGPLNLTAQEYRQAFEDASSDESFKALILYTRSQIVENKLDQASASISQLYASAATPVQKDEAAMVDAMLLSKKNQFDEAQQKLSAINYKALPKQDISYFLVLNSNVNSNLYNKTHDPKYQITAFKSESALERYVTRDSDKRKVLLKSVDLLKQLDDQTLSAAYTNVKNDTDKGFYEYAIIDKSSNTQLKDQMMETFAKKYPNHPLMLLSAPEKAEPVAQQEVSDVTPKGGKAVAVDSQALFSIQDGDQIAVLLPLSGRFASAVGEPAKLGILTALKDRGSKAKVTFYDTNKTNISQIVATVSANGTKLVIGPILKPEVNAMNAAGIKIPSITLNSPEGNRPVNQWYFDLGPNYEGAIAASKIYADGYKSPVVIGLSSDKASQRSVNSFMNTFGKVNNNAVVCNYSNPANVGSEIAKCPFGSADSAYVSASVIDAVQIKAAIPSNIAVYLTDKSYMGVNNSSQELALKGAILGDMPWVLTDSSLKESFMKSMPKANSQVQRIFAASYDAVNFAFNIKQLASNQNDVLHGLSGDISLGRDGLIESTPMWVELGSVR
ncbi:Outer membrane lipoprotein LpoA, binds and activates PBP1a [Succinivibrio dextrinosolvens DSM 3072]|uniref:Outer membrane lipoprotein LpoA, binds and activates PBP1a n=1 Tax=Succinivibrio dextrinosolvens DSM 3072 TaxID=1123324 RepID=A0A1T4V515_9GAMM|nr:penicillin-binding protein activator [Succinivibrio dextrinosolvens]SKA60037.1 Outer membrane lipoprotein LpoA, binds and activates PBP1a [Succinivibrio dextrinosolvens DSM 3072]